MQQKKLGFVHYRRLMKILGEVQNVTEVSEIQ